VDRADQRERIEVLLAPAQAPVQARGGRAAGMAGREVAEDGAAGHRLPRGHHRVDRLVGAAQAVGVVDGDHVAVDQEPGVGDDPVGDGEHRVARVAAEVDTSVSGTPRRIRRIEAAQHRVRRRQRPREAGRRDRSRWGLARRGTAQRQHHEQQSAEYR
jgi:hypothetical protein